MRMPTKSPLARYWPVTLLVAGGVALGAWHNSQVRRNRPDPLTGTVRAVFSLPAGAITRLIGWTGGQTGWLLRGRGLSAENERLTRRIADLESENARLRESQITLDRLRTDLNFVRTIRKPPLAAEIWCRRPDPKYDTIIISRGSRDGVKPHDLVISREGVVGYVSEADTFTAAVVLLTDQNATLGARVQRATSRAIGLCRGNNGPLLTMTDIDHESDVKPGDLVVTSGLSRLYPRTLEGTPPRDLIIGVIVRVQTDPSSAGKTALVRPKADYSRLEEVYVLR